MMSISRFDYIDEQISNSLVELLDGNQKSEGVQNHRLDGGKKTRR